MSRGTTSRSQHRNTSTQRASKRFRRKALATEPMCHWCGCSLDAASATTDHLLSLAEGGAPRDERNMILSCGPCNSARQNANANRPND
jgi:hypothetical protein